MRAMRIVTTAIAIAAVLAAVGASGAAGRASSAATRVTLYASGLDNPRGLTFGPNGNLYVAEGGDPAGNTLMSVGKCTQVGEVGPYLGGFTSRISKIDRQGHRSTVVGGLPSSSTSPQSGSLTSGVADVEFVDHKLYALEAGAGCSHGLVGTHNSLFRVRGDGTRIQVRNLSSFQKEHPVAHPDCCPGDFEPDGTWFSMVGLHNAIYAVEPNHGEVDRITQQGKMSRVVDVSAKFGHAVPTSLSVHGGDLFFGNLGVFPVAPGTQSIWKLTPSGKLTLWASGLTTVLGTAWDGHGHLYALESITAAGFPGANPAGTGRVVRVPRHEPPVTVVDGLTTPTAMTFGPDGALYISNNGFGAPPGAGQILRVALH
jgi:hypothetical protein